MKKSSEKGVTLTEIMIVLVILSVTAALAIPNYFKTLEESRANEGRAELQAIHMGQKIFRENNGRYYPTAGGTVAVVATMNDNLHTDLTDTADDYYDLAVVTDVNNNTANYSATATRNRSGSTKVFTVDQTGSITPSGNY